MDVRVKPLEWEPAPISSDSERFIAKSAFGLYEVLRWSDGSYGGSIPPDWSDGDYDAPSVEFYAASMDEAKAAAQADFESRILAALAPTQEG